MFYNLYAFATQVCKIKHSVREGERGERGREGGRGRDNRHNYTVAHKRQSHGAPHIDSLIHKEEKFGKGCEPRAISLCLCEAEIAPGSEPR